MPSAVAQTSFEKTIHGGVVRLVQDDLVALAVDAIVFYAREDLALGSGFGTAIQTRGGDSIKKELAAIGSVRMGEAVMTGAGNLAARHIVHACGPKFQEPQVDEKLRSCMAAALKVAREAGLHSIAFPPMGAGFYGVPLDQCAETMVKAFDLALFGDAAPGEIVVCARDAREFAAFRKKMEAL